ncbi:MAG: hypothetical protein LBS77_01120, partial [Desulfovibrio sp.]|nr:hypothetical protein [Desulfovibrio sp.]
KGAEIYCGASTERQAWEVFKSARLMATWNEEYKSAFGLVSGAKNLSVPATNSKFESFIDNPGEGIKELWSAYNPFKIYHCSPE